MKIKRYILTYVEGSNKECIVLTTKDEATRIIQVKIYDLIMDFMEGEEKYQILKKQSIPEVINFGKNMGIVKDTTYDDGLKKIRYEIYENEIELSDEEITAAHRKFVTDWMCAELESQFNMVPSDAAEAAEQAYNKYCEGDGLTEYECIEWTAEEWRSV